MADDFKDARFRKFAPTDREHPIFELVHGDDVLLDVSMSDEGTLEVAFHDGSANKVVSFEQLTSWLADGRRLVEAEKDE